MIKNIADFIEGIFPEADIVVNHVLDDASVQDMNFVSHNGLAGYGHIVCRSEDEDVVRAIVQGKTPLENRRGKGTGDLCIGYRVSGISTILDLYCTVRPG